MVQTNRSECCGTKRAEQTVVSMQGGDGRPVSKGMWGRLRYPVFCFYLQLFFVVVLAAALGTGSFWALKEWRDYTHKMDVQIGLVQKEIINLRAVLTTRMEAQLIRLKIMVLRPKIDVDLASEIATAVSKYAKIYNRDPDLILAVMRIESAFDPKARSRVGAMGLMQIMPHWVEVLDIRCSLDDPDCNTKYGIQILGAYEQLYGNLDMALTAYNRGPGPVDYALMRGKDPDNGYAGKVKTVYSRLRAISGNEDHIELAFNADWK